MQNCVFPTSSQEFSYCVYWVVRKYVMVPYCWNQPVEDFPSLLGGIDEENLISSTRSLISKLYDGMVYRRSLRTVAGTTPRTLPYLTWTRIDGIEMSVTFRALVISFIVIGWNLDLWHFCWWVFLQSKLREFNSISGVGSIGILTEPISYGECLLYTTAQSKILPM